MMAQLPKHIKKWRKKESLGKLGWVVGCWLGMMLVVVSVGLVARFQGVGRTQTKPAESMG